VIHSVSPYQVTDTDFIRKTGAQDSAIPAISAAALAVGVGRQCRAPRRSGEIDAEDPLPSSPNTYSRH
jgi:hypothetical protein